jgi:hypothetical protein
MFLGLWIINIVLDANGLADPKHMAILFKRDGLYTGVKLRPSH